MFEWLTRAAFRRDAPRQPGSPRPGGGDRFPLFDSMRGVAAISIVLCHLTGVTSFAPIHSWVVHLNAGVTVFFLISGFLLYRPFAKAHLRGESRFDLGAYAWRRILRIVPAYWVALTLISLWLGRDPCSLRTGPPTCCSLRSTDPRCSSAGSARRGHCAWRSPSTRSSRCGRPSWHGAGWPTRPPGCGGSGWAFSASCW